MKRVFQIFLFVFVLVSNNSIYAEDQSQKSTSDTILQKMTREQVLISSRSASSPDVIGGVIMHPEYQQPSSSSNTLTNP